MSSISARRPRFSTSSSTMRRLSRLASSSTSFRWTLISASRVCGESATWVVEQLNTHQATELFFSFILILIISECWALLVLRQLFFSTTKHHDRVFPGLFLATGNKNYLGLYVYKGCGCSLKSLQDLLYRFLGKLQKMLWARTWSWLVLAPCCSGWLSMKQHSEMYHSKTGFNKETKKK